MGTHLSELKPHVVLLSQIGVTEYTSIGRSPVKKRLTFLGQYPNAAAENRNRGTLGTIATCLMRDFSQTICAQLKPFGVFHGTYHRG